MIDELHGSDDWSVNEWSDWFIRVLSGIPDPSLPVRRETEFHQWLIARHATLSTLAARLRMAQGAAEVIKHLSPIPGEAQSIYYLLQFAAAVKCPGAGSTLRRWYMEGVLKRLWYDTQPLDVLLLGALGEYELDLHPALCRRIATDARQSTSFAFVLSAHRTVAAIDVALGNSILPALIALARSQGEITQVVRHLAVFSRKYTWAPLLAVQLGGNLSSPDLLAFNNILKQVDVLLGTRASADTSRPLACAVLAAHTGALTAESLLSATRACLLSELLEPSLRQIVRIERTMSRHIDLRTEAGFARALRAAPSGLRVLVVNGGSAEYDADAEPAVDAALQHAILPEVSPGLLDWIDGDSVEAAQPHAEPDAKYVQ